LDGPGLAGLGERGGEHLAALIRDRDAVDRPREAIRDGCIGGAINGRVQVVSGRRGVGPDGDREIVGQPSTSREQRP
jgi:hypothetical protein